MKGIQALQALLDNKKVRRKNWGPEEYIIYDPEIRKIFSSAGGYFSARSEVWAVYNDWELYVEQCGFNEAMKHTEHGGTARRMCWKDGLFLSNLSPSGVVAQTPIMRYVNENSQGSYYVTFKDINAKDWVCE